MTEHDAPVRPTLVEIEADECLRLVAHAVVGRLGFVNQEGDPTVLPVNHVVDADGVYFRTTFGAKLDLAQRLSGARVAFEVDDIDAETRTGWSVLARGSIEPVLDTVTVAHLDRLAHHTWADDVQRTAWVRIAIDDLTGRRIEAPTDA